MSSRVTLSRRVMMLIGAAVGLLAGACSLAVSPPPLPMIVAADEPGSRLTVAGGVFDAVGGDPIVGAQVRVYQADQSGTYQPDDPADESTARIRGDLTTGTDGTFGFVTVLPGEYPDQPPGNRHIHFHSVTADGYEPRGFVMLFDDNVRAEVRDWAKSTGLGIVVELDGTPETGFVAPIDIALEPVP